MAGLIDRHAKNIAGVLSCFDRLVSMYADVVPVPRVVPGVGMDFLLAVTPIGKGSALRMDPRVELVVKLIESQPKHGFSVDELCNQLRVSPSHLQHLFKRDVHMSIREFILRTRLNAAAVMIGTSCERIRQISFAAGFSDISNFNHAFKRQFGVCPRKYRLRSVLATEPSELSDDDSFDQ